MMCLLDVNSIVRSTREELNMTKDMIHEIFTKNLNKWNVCAWFVPSVLTEKKKKILELNIAEALLWQPDGTGLLE